MTIYAVLAPPPLDGSTRQTPERFVFVKEGFSWLAFFVTIPWLIWRRMWLVLVVYLLLTAALLPLAEMTASPVSAAIFILFGILVGLEANNLRRWTLERRGYRFVGAAVGDSMVEAEYRFFAAWMAAEVANSTQRPAMPRLLARPRTTGGEIVGLFPSRVRS
jgi:Protein of unknown function (DUF2628)